MPSARNTGTGSEAEEERTKRSADRSTASPLRAARARIAWCIVGTAVYQVGRTSSSQPKNLSASKPGVQEIAAPALTEDSIAAISP